MFVSIPHTKLYTGWNCEYGKSNNESWPAIPDKGHCATLKLWQTLCQEIMVLNPEGVTKVLSTGIDGHTLTTVKVMTPLIPYTKQRFHSEIFHSEILALEGLYKLSLEPIKYMDIMSRQVTELKQFTAQKQFCNS